MTRADEGLKQSKQALGAEVISRFNDFAPPTLLAQAARINFSTRLFNLVVTNVPGPQIPLYLLGRELEDIFPVGFLPPHQALFVAIMSYNGGINFGLLADYDSMDDLEVIAEGIERSRSRERADAAGACPPPKNLARTGLKSAVRARRRRTIWRMEMEEGPSRYHLELTPSSSRSRTRRCAACSTTSATSRPAIQALIHEVLAKLPDEHAIRAIRLDAERERRGDVVELATEPRGEPDGEATRSTHFSPSERHALGGTGERRL